MEVSFKVSDNSSTNSRSSGPPHPSLQPVRMSTIFCERTRQGTHLPHDSLRKNRAQFRAISNIHLPSAHTTIAAEPSMEPVLDIDLKSRATSIIDPGKNPEAAPEGAHAFTFFPSRGPPASFMITSDAEVPMGTSKTPGLRTSPLTPTNFRPAAPFRPAALYQSGPRSRICAIVANVSTLFNAVGLPHKPTVAELGGLIRGSARLPSMASRSALPSPQMYPPGLMKISMS